MLYRLNASTIRILYHACMGGRGETQGKLIDVTLGGEEACFNSLGLDYYGNEILSALGELPLVFFTTGGTLEDGLNDIREKRWAVDLDDIRNLLMLGIAHQKVVYIQGTTDRWQVKL